MGFNLGKTLKGGMLGGGGLGLLGGLGGGGGGNMRRLLMEMQRKKNLADTQAQGYGLRGLRSLEQGYDKALVNADRTGLATKMDVEAAGAQNNAAIAQSFAGRGLYNTTAYDAARTASMGTTARSLASVDQAIAGLKGNLQTQKGHAMAGGYGALGSLAERRGQSDVQLGQFLAQLEAMQPDEFAQFMQLFGAAGSLLPLMFLGGGGGAAAGAAGSYTPVFP